MAGESSRRGLSFVVGEKVVFLAERQGVGPGVFGVLFYGNNLQSRLSWQAVAPIQLGIANSVLRMKSEATTVN